MSAAPLDSAESVKDGLSTVGLSLAAMAARLVLSKDRPNPWRVAAFTFAACLSGYLAGRVTLGVMDPGLRDAVIGLAAYTAPELLSFALRIVKARGREAVKDAEKKSRRVPRRRR